MNKISVKFYGTKNTIAENFTKPLQGALSRKFRAELMNIAKYTDMSEMGMYGNGLTEGVTRKLQNETNTTCPQECGRVPRKNMTTCQ